MLTQLLKESERRERNGIATIVQETVWRLTLVMAGSRTGCGPCSPCSLSVR